MKTLFSLLFSGATGGLSWVVSHVRLIIEYALIAAVVALAGVAFEQHISVLKQQLTVGKLNSDVQNAQRNLQDVQEANKQQEDAIQQLSELRERDSLEIAGLQTDIASNHADVHAVRAKLVSLEKNNAQAKLLFDTAVPDAVGCLLDGTNCPAASSDQNGHADTAAGR